MTRQSPTFGQTFLAALVGGAIGGVLFFLPYISILNWCCCVGIVLSALLSGFILTRFTGNGLTTGEGLSVGTLAGLLAGAAFGIFAGAMMLSPGAQQFIRDELMRNPGFSSGSQRQQVEQMLPTLMSPLGAILVGLFFTIPSTIAGLLGGLIASLIWKPQQPLEYYQPPAPPQVPLPPPAAPSA